MERLDSHRPGVSVFLVHRRCGYGVFLPVAVGGWPDAIHIAKARGVAGDRALWRWPLTERAWGEISLGSLARLRGAATHRHLLCDHSGAGALDGLACADCSRDSVFGGILDSDALRSGPGVWNSN